MKLERDYQEIRKVRWDQLWHALWIDSCGEMVWDRVDRSTALRIARKIESKHVLWTDKTPTKSI